MQHTNAATRHKHERREGRPCINDVLPLELLNAILHGRRFVNIKRSAVDGDNHITARGDDDTWRRDPRTGRAYVLSRRRLDAWPKPGDYYDDHIEAYSASYAAAPPCNMPDLIDPDLVVRGRSAAQRHLAARQYPTVRLVDRSDGTRDCITADDDAYYVPRAWWFALRGVCRMWRDIMDQEGNEQRAAMEPIRRRWELREHTRMSAFSLHDGRGMYRHDMARRERRFARQLALGRVVMASALVMAAWRAPRRWHGRPRALVAWFETQLPCPDKSPLSEDSRDSESLVPTRLWRRLAMGVALVCVGADPWMTYGVNHLCRPAILDIERAAKKCENMFWMRTLWSATAFDRTLEAVAECSSGIDAFAKMMSVARLIENCAARVTKEKKSNEALWAAALCSVDLCVYATNYIFSTHGVLAFGQLFARYEPFNYSSSVDVARWMLDVHAGQPVACATIPRGAVLILRNVVEHSLGRASQSPSVSDDCSSDSDSDENCEPNAWVWRFVSKHPEHTAAMLDAVVSRFATGRGPISSAARCAFAKLLSHANVDGVSWFARFWNQSASDLALSLGHKLVTTLADTPLHATDACLRLWDTIIGPAASRLDDSDAASLLTLLVYTKRLVRRGIWPVSPDDGAVQVDSRTGWRYESRRGKMLTRVLWLMCGWPTRGAILVDARLVKVVAMTIIGKDHRRRLDTLIALLARCDPSDPSVAGFDLWAAIVEYVRYHANYGYPISPARLLAALAGIACVLVPRRDSGTDHSTGWWPSDAITPPAILARLARPVPVERAILADIKKEYSGHRLVSPNKALADLDARGLLC